MEYHLERKGSQLGTLLADDQVTHVLIVDDDDDIRSLLSDFLERNHLIAFQATDGEAMRKMILSHRIDLIVLDLNLPGEDGLSLCRQLRASSNIPIIMLTAKSDPIDRIVGLETGSDDYVCKPFEPLELLSRIRSVLRRTQQLGNSSTKTTEAIKMHFADWVLDLTARHLLDPQGVIISLSGAEFRLLKMFLDRP